MKKLENTHHVFIKNMGDELYKSQTRSEKDESDSNGVFEPILKTARTIVDTIEGLEKIPNGKKIMIALISSDYMKTLNKVLKAKKWKLKRPQRLQIALMYYNITRYPCSRCAKKCGAGRSSLSNHISAERRMETMDFARGRRFAITKEFFPTFISIFTYVIVECGNAVGFDEAREFMKDIAIYLEIEGADDMKMHNKTLKGYMKKFGFRFKNRTFRGSQYVRAATPLTTVSYLSNLKRTCTAAKLVDSDGNLVPDALRRIVSMDEIGNPSGKDKKNRCFQPTGTSAANSEISQDDTVDESTHVRIDACLNAILKIFHLFYHNRKSAELYSII